MPEMDELDRSATTARLTLTPESVKSVIFVHQKMEVE
jgi:hypothetical protein